MNTSTAHSLPWRPPAQLLSLILSAIAWLALHPCGAGECTPAPGALAAWWSFDGDASDQLGGASVVWVGGPAFVPGQVHQGLSLDGVNDSGRVGASPALNVGAGDGLTLECWIKPVDASRIGTLVEWNSGTGRIGAHFHVSVPSSVSGAGSLFANLVDTGGVSHQVGSASGLLRSGEFQHMALTYDKTTGLASLYHDGIQVAQTNLGVFTPDTRDHLYLGNRPSGPVAGTYFAGVLDEVSICGRALGAEEIALIHAAAGEGKCVTPRVPEVTAQPQDRNAFEGDTVAFTVAAAGSAPLTFQWWFGEAPLTEAVGPTLRLQSVMPANAGDYWVVVANAAGSVTSQVARLTVVPVPPCASVPPGLVAWWVMDDSGNDWLGQNPLTLLGSPAFGPGRVAGGLQFDGVNEYGRVSAPVGLDVGAGDGLTVEAWINPSDAGLMGTLVEWNNGRGTIGAHFCVSVPSSVSGAGSLFANLVDTSGISHQVGSPVGILRPNEFQHVALTYDRGSGEAALYLDGAQVTLTNLGVFTPDTRHDVYVGVRPSGPIAGTYFAGTMDEVSIFERALSADELALLRAASAGGKCREAMPAAIVNQPQSRSVFVGQSATFRVSATGTAPLTFQWYHGENPFPDGTGTVLVLENVQLADAGDYWVVVANAGGSVTSQVAILTVAPVPSCATAPAGLVAWWPMDGTGADYLSTNPLNLQGAPSFAPGQVDQALSLDGMNDSAIAPASAELNVGAGDGLTIEAWIKPRDARLMGTVAEWNNGAGSIGAHLCVSVPSSVSGAGSLFANLVDTQGISHQIGTATGLLRANEYQHVAVTYNRNSGQAALYLDGSIVGETNLGVFVPQTSYDFYVGVRPSGPIAGTFFRGEIDELSVYGRVLTADEIGMIAAAAGGGKCRTAMPPSITSQPQSLDRFAGDTATLRVTASGTGPLAYQWLFNGADIEGAVGPALTLNSVRVDQAGRYSVRVSNSAGTVTSDEAALTVELNTSPPVITRQPLSHNVDPGNTIVLSLVATGAQPLRYQWQFNEAPLPDATDSILRILNAQEAHAGTYSVIVSNDHGFAVSDEALLTVTNAFAGGVINFANRGVGVDAPVFDVDGVTEVSGPDYRAELVAGPTLATMAVVAPSAGFIMPGYFMGGNRTLSNVNAGQPAYAQVRVWDQSRGLTYEEAAANGGKTGASSIFTVVTGGGGIPPSLPASLTGLTSFALTNTLAAAPLPPRLLLAPAGRLENGAFEWVVTGPSDARCVIERSVDLVNWSGFTLIRTTNGVARFTGPAAARQSYFRARVAD